MLVKEAMRAKVLTLSPEATVADAAGMMQINGIKGIPIIDTTGNLTGIIANIDIMKTPHDSWRMTRVKDVMSTDLAVVRAEDRLDYAMNYMRQRNIGRLPVVEDKNPLLIWNPRTWWKQQKTIPLNNPGKHVKIALALIYFPYL
jgi:predicted transcriptional regulator